MPAATLPPLALQTPEGAPLTLLRYRNARGGSFRYEPDRFRVTVDLDAWRAALPAVERVALDLPAGWVVLPDRVQPTNGGRGALEWTVFPAGRPAAWRATLAARALARGRLVGTTSATLPVEIVAESPFDPARHALPWANAVADLGVVHGDERTFRETYRWSILPRAFFHGLYRAIVFIGGADRGYQGGLCTGMARAALRHALSVEIPGTGAAALEEVLVLHGRQLTDRALLAAARDVLRPSPRRAYLRFRDDLLARGSSDVCFDLGVPRLWRRDIASALMAEGHTVVPYRLRQASDDLAEVVVYDPNDPLGTGDDASVVTFDLRGDSYAYRGLAALGGRATTVVAVRQPAYERGRTALLTSLASLALFPRSLDLAYGHRWRWAAGAPLALLLPIAARRLQGRAERAVARRA